MKKVLLGLSVLLAGFSGAKAQAFDENSKLITVGLGFSSYYYINSGNVYSAGWGNRGWGGPGWSPVTGELLVQGEFAVHKYVGVGFFAGIGGRALGGGSGELNIPVAALANFHFYQLIADKTGKNIHADKLDIYAGANIGTGWAGFFNNNSEHVADYALIFGSPIHAGIRYYFTPNIAVNGEVGWGKTLMNGGITFKL